MVMRDGKLPASLFLVLLLLSSPDFVEPSFLGLGRSLLVGVNVKNVPDRSNIVKAGESPERRRHFMSSLSESTDQSISEIGDLPFKVLGVAGGIGSGKSTACRLLEDLGCLAHIDADKVAHSVYEPGNAARSELVEAFGKSIVNDDDDDGSINRPALGSIVFSDPSKLRRLENIVWPHTQRMVTGMLQSVRPDESKRPIVIVEAAMLLDADWCQWMDGVWMVTADPSACQQRIVDRGGTVEQAIQRIQAQSTRRGIQNLHEEVEKGVVSAVITNNGSIEDLKELLLSKLDDETAWYTQE